MRKTTIEWTDFSWPIVNGCRRISPGCGGPDGGGCYAERLAATRLRHLPKYEGLATFKPGVGPRWTGKSRLWLPDLDAPLADGPDAGDPVDASAWPTPKAIEHDLDGTVDGYQGAPVRVRLHDKAGGDMNEWPMNLRVRQFPAAREGARA